jgi:hypothetical protein
MQDNSTELHLGRLLISEMAVDSKGGTMATAKPAVAPMKVVQVPKPGADFQIVEREMPTPLFLREMRDQRSLRSKPD